MRDHLGSSSEGTIVFSDWLAACSSRWTTFTRRAGSCAELGADYFHFDAAKHQMLGERSGKRYRLGDRVRVKS